jgi:hypothetical protein
MRGGHHAAAPAYSEVCFVHWNRLSFLSHFTAASSCEQAIENAYILLL